MNDQQRKDTKGLIGEYHQEINDLYYKINRNGFLSLTSLALVGAIVGLDGTIATYQSQDTVLAILSGASAVINGVSAIKRIRQREEMRKCLSELEGELAHDESQNSESKAFHK